MGSCGHITKSREGKPSWARGTRKGLEAGERQFDLGLWTHSVSSNVFKT